MVVQQGSIHTLRELLSKKKSPVSDAFDSNVNNSNAVNISFYFAQKSFGANSTAKLHLFSEKVKKIIKNSTKSC